MNKAAELQSRIDEAVRYIKSAMGLTRSELLDILGVPKEEQEEE